MAKIGDKFKTLIPICSAHYLISTPTALPVYIPDGIIVEIVSLESDDSANVKFDDKIIKLSIPNDLLDNKRFVACK